MLVSAKGYTTAEDTGTARTEQNGAAADRTPYNQFPDSPRSYRDNTDTTPEALFRGAVAHAHDRTAWYDKKGRERSSLSFSTSKSAVGGGSVRLTVRMFVLITETMRPGLVRAAICRPLMSSARSLIRT